VPGVANRAAAIRAAHRRRQRALGRVVVLPPDEVVEINRRALAGESVAALAAEYGIAPARVRRCATNRAVAWLAGSQTLPALVP
jgi:hypothetical protein